MVPIIPTCNLPLASSFEISLAKKLSFIVSKGGGKILRLLPYIKLASFSAPRMVAVAAAFYPVTIAGMLPSDV